MLNLSSLDRDGIDTLIFDVDDTITDAHHHLSEKTLGALHRLKAAGFTLGAATGRPLGYAEVLLAYLPIDFAIGENGGGHLLKNKDGIRSSAGEDLWKGARDETAAWMQKTFPDIHESNDSTLRRVDLSFDLHEFSDISDARLADVTTELDKRGLVFLRSSIHLHVMPVARTKADAALELLGELGKTREQCVVIGDSPNDESLFAAFANSVGVANVDRYVDSMKSKPRFKTEGERCDGFAELAAYLLD